MFELIRGHRAIANAVHCTFDLMEFDGEDLRRLPIEDRKQRLASGVHRFDGRFAGSVAVGVNMKHRLHDRLQIASGNLLSDAVSNCRHTPSELHSYPIDLWDRLKSSTRFIRCVGSGSSS